MTSIDTKSYTRIHAHPLSRKVTPASPTYPMPPSYASRSKSTTRQMCAPLSVTADELDHFPKSYKRKKNRVRLCRPEYKVCTSLLFLSLHAPSRTGASVLPACPWTVDAAARVVMDIALHTRTPPYPHRAAIFLRPRLPSDSALSYVSRGTCAVSPV
ncbi:hypothetical protein DFH06DRAFT_1230280 [Mycena polygramma]|nr:hypothetical protein DFH06DRAFT_1230280 [Mycena polygramma]